MTGKDFKYRVLSLSERLFPMVARILGNDDDARDALQEIMIKLWERRQQIDRHPNLTGFVFLTARNYCLDRLKKKNPEQRGGGLPDSMDGIYSGQEQLEQKEVFLIVQKIIDDLPDNQKEVILMRDIDGFEFHEIAAATGLEVTHIRVLLSRARKQVRVQLEKIYNYGQGTT